MRDQVTISVGDTRVVVAFYDDDDNEQAYICFGAEKAAKIRKNKVLRGMLAAFREKYPTAQTLPNTLFREQYQNSCLNHKTLTALRNTF